MMQEVLAEATRALGHRLLPWGGLTAAALLLLLAEWKLRERWPTWRRRIHAGVLTVAVGLGFWRGWSVLWLADDAYISFRYARNFARGLGLVFNEGEWVEGYTNFLWTFLLGLSGKLGLEIPLVGLFGSLLAFVLALLAVAWAVRRLSPEGVGIPFAALALALCAPFTNFASSGLETMPIACLVALAMGLGTLRHGHLWAGVALTAAVLCRPDQVLLWGSMGLALVGEDLWLRRERPLWKRLDLFRYLVFAAPFLLIYVPYFLIRWRVYGDMFPNTFYAKSGSGSYLSQGWFYLVHFLVTSGGWLFVALFFFCLWGPSRSREESRIRLFALFGVTFLGAYIVRVGGDFMEHRFFVPLLPLIAISTESGLRWRLGELAGRRSRWALVGAAALALGVAAVPIQLIPAREIRWGLASEHTFYPVQSLSPFRMDSEKQDDGEWLHRAFVQRGLEPKLAVGAMGMVAYYSELPIVDAFGLVNRRLAHKAVAMRRHRPGHEKRATRAEFIEEGALIKLTPTYSGKWREATRGEVDGRSFFLFRYDPALMAEMSRFPEIHLPDPERQIRSLALRERRSLVLDAIPFYRSFLAGHPERERWMEPLTRRLSAVADFEGELPEPCVVEGRALRTRSGRLPPGASGRGWLSSRGRQGVGRMEIPLGSRSGELRFALGGSDSPAVGVELWVDGQAVRRAQPSGAPGLWPVLWEHAEQGSEARLVIWDDDPDPDVYVEVDGIHWASERGDLRQRVLAYRESGAGFASLLREAEELLPAEDPDRVFLQGRLLERYSFGAAFPPGAEVAGEAFVGSPVEGASARQQPIAGFPDAFLNSSEPGDRSHGALYFPERELRGERIHFLVGGGPDCKLTFVGLEVEGEVVERACGLGDKFLRPASLSTEPWLGKRGRLVVVDADSGEGGYILMDDLIFEAPFQATRGTSSEEAL